jgi:hypothetical protein
MSCRGTLWVLIAVVVCLVSLVPLCGAGRPGDGGPDPIPVHGSVLPAGDFVGTLRIVSCTLDAAGRLRLTGVLTGTVTHQTARRIPVTEQPFTAPVTLRDAGRSTDVVRLALAPLALDPSGVRIKLAPVTIDFYTVPDVGDELATLLPQP